MLKKTNKLIIIFGVLSLLYAPVSFGIVAPLDVAPTTQIVSKGVAILLSCMQILQYAIPILFFIIKLIINNNQHNNKNTLKNILIYLVISAIIGLVFVGIGNLILENTSNYGYSSKSINYINYNGKIVFYHR